MPAKRKAVVVEDTPITICIVPECGRDAIAESTYCAEHKEENDAIIAEQLAKEAEEKRIYKIENDVMLTKEGYPISLLSQVSLHRVTVNVRTFDCLLIPLPKKYASNDELKLTEEQETLIKDKLSESIIKDEGKKGHLGTVNNLQRMEGHIYHILDSLEKWRSNFFFLHKLDKPKVDKAEVKEQGKREGIAAVVNSMPEMALRSWASNMKGIDDELPLDELRQAMLAVL